MLVWRLDRWGRSVTDLLATLQELEHLGVGFVSLTEALDLTTPAGFFPVTSATTMRLSLTSRMTSAARGRAMEAAISVLASPQKKIHKNNPPKKIHRCVPHEPGVYFYPLDKLGIS